MKKQMICAGNRMPDSMKIIPMAMTVSSEIRRRLAIRLICPAPKFVVAIGWMVCPTPVKMCWNMPEQVKTTPKTARAVSPP